MLCPACGYSNSPESKLCTHCAVLLVGERALAGNAYEEALDHFRCVLAAREGQPMDAEKAELLFGLGRAQAGIPRRHPFQEVLANLRQAFDYYVEAGNLPRAIAIVEYPISPLPGQRTGLVELTARALALVPPDSHEAGRLLLRHGWAMVIDEGDNDGARVAFDRAIAIARRVGDASLEMRTLVISSRVDLYDLQWKEGLEKSLSAIELAPRADEPGTEASARYFAVQTLISIGDLERARLHAVPMLDLAERLPDQFELTSALWLNEAVARLGGDWRAARQLSDRGLTVTPQDMRLLTTRVFLECEAGEFGRGEAYLEGLLEILWPGTPGPTFECAITAMAIPVVARITGVVDGFNIAEEAAEAVLSSPSVTPIFGLWAQTGLGLIAVQKGDAVSAGEQYAALRCQRGTMLGVYGLATDRLLALLSLAQGLLEEARAHAEDSLTFCRKAGYLPELAWTGCDYADALLQRAGDHDRAKAMSLLEESLVIARDLGMRPLVERIAARLALLES